MIKQKKGEEGFLDWKMAKAQERIDREQYLRTLAFHASLAEIEQVGAGL